LKLHQTVVTITFVFSHEEVIEKLKKYFALFLVPAIVLGVLFCIFNFGKVYADAPVNRTPLYTSYAWFACMAVLGGMAKYADFENKFTSFMTKKSWGLYVFHYLGISMVAIWLVKPGFISAVPAYLLSTIAAFAVAFVLYEIISRIPVYRWMVLGIKKDKKRN
jgi:peptidoglycan/LPS O-acetylase OafA/YrhL